MNAIGRRFRCFMASGLAIILGALAPTALGGDLHVIFAADRKAENVGDDLDCMVLNFVCAANLPKSQWKPHFLDYRRPMSESDILTAIRSVPIGPDDTLMFYYVGHGAYADPVNGTYLTPSGSSGRVLFASRLVEEVKARGPRLAVVVLDCCNRKKAPPAYAAPAPALPGELQQPTPLFDELFFKRSGVILALSSSPGEYALVKPAGDVADDGVPPGPIFTNSLADTLSRNAQTPMEWSQMLGLTQQQVDQYFNAMMGAGKTLQLQTGEIIRQERQTIQLRFYR
ncbi:caspase family protein [Paludisphaera rhizosphaerae]|uniref:caspase family protein n=1 Tax=Paludisphaera rhizosphaerae TaxID=2711216 RepID=UPI0013E9B8BC|nr:caspase family protein [Paludisphaera rhizosphaerae]